MLQAVLPGGHDGPGDRRCVVIGAVALVRDPQIRVPVRRVRACEVFGQVTHAIPIRVTGGGGGGEVAKIEPLPGIRDAITITIESVDARGG